MKGSEKSRKGSGRSRKGSDKAMVKGSDRPRKGSEKVKERHLTSCSALRKADTRETAAHPRTKLLTT